MNMPARTALECYVPTQLTPPLLGQRCDLRKLLLENFPQMRQKHLHHTVGMRMNELMAKEMSTNTNDCCQWEWEGLCVLGCNAVMIVIFAFSYMTPMKSYYQYSHSISCNNYVQKQNHDVMIHGLTSCVIGMIWVWFECAMQCPTNDEWCDLTPHKYSNKSKL